jgi:predicted dehydrogenase
MLEKETLDLVCVITRSDQHSRMACDCLEGGVHVVVTKPWARNEAEAVAMVEAAGRSGTLLMPWLPARWGCDVTRLRALAAEQAIGDIFLVRRTVAGFGTRCDWQTEQRYGGGYLLNWGPHIVDQALFLQEQPVASAYGQLRQINNPGDTEDVFMATLTLANRAVVLAEYTVAACELPTWIVQGNRGTIVVRGRDIEITRRVPVQPGDPTNYASMKGSEGETVTEPLEGAVYGDEKQIYAEIAAAIRGETPFAVTPAHALALTRTLDAIRLADRDNRVVPL